MQFLKMKLIKFLMMSRVCCIQIDECVPKIDPSHSKFHVLSNGSRTHSWESLVFETAPGAPLALKGSTN